MTEQHILNELYKAQGELERAQSIVHAYQDVIRAADKVVDLVFDHPFRIASTMGGPFMAAIDNLQQALKHAYDPNGDAE